MSIDKTCITSVTSTKVAAANSSCTTSDLVALSATVNQLTTGRQSYVTLACDLPDLYLGTTPQGTMFYVRELEVPVVATDQAWTGLDGRTYRKDVPDFTLYSWGCNGAGKLGVGTTAHASSPIQEFSSSINWCMTSVGYNNAWAIKRNGTLWGVGCSNVGQVPSSSTGNFCSFVQEASLSTNWCYVGGSSTFHGAALKTDGSLFTYGCNAQGQLGTQDTANRSSPVRELTSSSWIMVSAGGYHTAAIKSSGEIWTWGRNINGALGDGTTICRSSPVQEASSSTNWCCIESGQDINIALKTDGSYWTWGYNFYGGSGINCTIVQSSPVQEITSSTNWCVVDTQVSTSGGIKTDGTLWNWGFNIRGQLGLNNTVNYSSPVQEITSGTSWCDMGVGRFHTLGIKTDGSLWGWGQQTAQGGSLGDGTTICRSSPVQEITSATNWKEVNGGFDHTVAIKSII